MRGTVRLEELYEQYRGDIHFLMVYIREAHPIDGWWLGGRLTRPFARRFSPGVAFDLYDAQSLAERRAVAGLCQDSLHLQIPTVVDDMDNSTNRAYAAWPTRLYLIGRDGRVVYAGGLGPWGYHPAELGAAMAGLVPNHDA